MWNARSGLKGFTGYSHFTFTHTLQLQALTGNSVTITIISFSSDSYFDFNLQFCTLSAAKPDFTLHSTCLISFQTFINHKVYRFSGPNLPDLCGPVMCLSLSFTVQNFQIQVEVGVDLGSGLVVTGVQGIDSEHKNSFEIGRLLLQSEIRRILKEKWRARAEAGRESLEGKVLELFIDYRFPSSPSLGPESTLLQLSFPYSSFLLRRKTDSSLLFHFVASGNRWNWNFRLISSSKLSFITYYRDFLRPWYVLCSGVNWNQSQK